MSDGDDAEVASTSSGSVGEAVEAPGSTDAPVVDASWWETVTLGEDAAAFEPAEMLEGRLRDLAARAEESVGGSALQTRVLQAMARVSSAMLDPDSWDEPFSPAIVFGNRTSVVPSDMGAEEFAVLAQALPLVEQVVLRARIADALWTYQRPRDPVIAAIAVDAYLSVPLTWDSWVRSGRDGYRRVIELARRQGKPGVVVLDKVAGSLRDFLMKDRGDGFMAASVSEVLRKTGRVTPEQSGELAARLSSLASELPDAHWRERALLREASTWWGRAGQPDEALACQVRVADSYAKESEKRMAGDRGALTASAPLEKAIAVLQVLPRKFRDANGLEEVISDRRRRLGELRQYSLEEMTSVGVESVDISQWVAQARKQVAGRERVDAVARFAQLSPLIDIAVESRETREQLSDALTRLFRRSTLSSDARKIADNEGRAGVEVTDDDVNDELVRAYADRVRLVVDALVLPASAALMTEHRFDMAFLESLCQESPTVPVGHIGLWARGLWHGFNGDFPSAVSLLVPQVEQFIRTQLKARGAYTCTLATAA